MLLRVVLGAPTLVQIVFLLHPDTLNRGASALRLYFGGPWVPQVCIHTRTRACSPGTWILEFRPGPARVSLKACSQKHHRLGPRETLLYVSGNSIEYCEGRAPDNSSNVRGGPGCREQGGAEQKCLGKRKSKLINLSSPSSQLECNRFQ